MKATTKDHAHFAAIAAATSLDEDEAYDRSAKMTPAERLAAGRALLDPTPWTPAQLAQIDADADAQLELARRRVAMGSPSTTIEELLALIRHRSRRARWPERSK